MPSRAMPYCARHGNRQKFPNSADLWPNDYSPSWTKQKSHLICESTPPQTLGKHHPEEPGHS
jgi:hypothetical protein